MATLRLIGIAQDVPLLKRLAYALRGTNFLCVIDAGSPPPTATSPFDQDSNSTKPQSIVIDIVCWTQASVDDERAELQERAKGLSEGEGYVSLLLDDVEAPEFALPSRTFRVNLRDPASDPKVLVPVVEWLRSQNDVTKERERASALANLRKISNETLLFCKDSISKIASVHKKVQFGLASLLLVTFTGAYGFFADVVGTQDKICSIQLINETCANHGWGNVPTKAERLEWEDAKKGDDCAVFLKIYARGGHFADEAKRRFDSAKYSDDSVENRFPLLIPYTEPPLEAEHMARAEVLVRADLLASEMCALHAQNFVKEDAPGRFEPKGDIQCVARGGGHACSVDGVAVCSFTKKNIVEACPSEAEGAAP
jgi:hypothetical protein